MFFFLKSILPDSLIFLNHQHEIFLIGYLVALPQTQGQRFDPRTFGQMEASRSGSSKSGDETEGVGGSEGRFPAEPQL